MSREDVVWSHLRALMVASDRHSIIKGLSKKNNNNTDFLMKQIRPGILASDLA